MKIRMDYSWRDDGEIYSLSVDDVELALNKFSKAIELGARYLSLTCFPVGVPANDEKLNSELDK